MTPMLFPEVRSEVPILANIGGPMSRTRTQTMSSSILGKDGGFVRCPRIIRLGLTFAPSSDPLDLLEQLLSEEGFGSPEDLRDNFAIPSERLICRPCSDPSGRIDVSKSAARLVLEQALLLGLCTAQIYDPLRPVLWTTSSVTRALELFDPSGFYA
jgi:hypothetical protein